MSEPNGQPAEAPPALLAGHLVVYGLPDGQGLLCFRPDGSNKVVRQPVPGFLTGPLVAALSGGVPDLGGMSPAGLMKRMVRGG